MRRAGCIQNNPELSLATGMPLINGKFHQIVAFVIFYYTQHWLSEMKFREIT